MARRPKPKPFKPFRVPSRPPSGFYDPALYSNLAAGQRGYTDLQQDTERDTARANSDLGLQQQGINQQAGHTLADILLARNRADQDYGIRTQDLNTQYRNQQSSQEQAANAAGILGHSGYQQGAAQVRDANQAHDQSALNLAHGRALEDLSLQQGWTETGRDQGLADVLLGYNRGGEDRAQTLGRAGRELGFFGTDTNQAATYQAVQAGWDAYAGRYPGERNRGHGVTTRPYPGGRYLLARGQVVNRTQLRNLLNRRKAQGR